MAEDNAEIQDTESAVEEGESAATDQPVTETAADPASQPGTSDKSKGQDPDAIWSDPVRAKTQYRELQGLTTRVAQENADQRLWRQQATQQLNDLAPKAAALDKLASDERFQAWAKETLINQQSGDDVDPEIAKLRYEHNQALERLRAEGEPARRAAQVAQAQASVREVEAKYPDVWAEFRPQIAAQIQACQGEAQTNPHLREMMDNPTPAFIEQLLWSVAGPRIREVGKKMYVADLEKKRKAQVSGREQVSQSALTPGARTIAAALAAAKLEHKVSTVSFGDEE